jgi:hypothetical protein
MPYRDTAPTRDMQVFVAGLVAEAVDRTGLDVEFIVDRVLVAAGRVLRQQNPQLTADQIDLLLADARRDALYDSAQAEDDFCRSVAREARWLLEDGAHD